eukprot:CAMPEP_0179333688 /NCGR_PEP_ID=MMETSP0797-20121207/65491_1 /TAXON_ID=47934 /ORGANISM="Dinophysis acuminata, Strain DAEP01" /LENGTH=75 /DNA_ID=CAMNT_0021046821 /DNA_START=49 /DNA_END=273 /DNA_ORIENTATION=+
MSRPTGLSTLVVTLRTYSEARASSSRLDEEPHNGRASTPPNFLAGDCLKDSRALESAMGKKRPHQQQDVAASAPS